MIIGVLGKGGAGKSTVATQLVKSFAKNDYTVLAIDADHNMDLTYNFGNPEMNYLGESIEEIKSHLGISVSDDYRSYFKPDTEKKNFKINPIDDFSKKYIAKIKDNIFLMSCGPQTVDVIEDRICSHGLFTSLKLYLPLLYVNNKEIVIVDEKAGADGVTTGVVTGFDLALIVFDSGMHSQKVALQIADLLEHYDTPYYFVHNKYNEIENPQDHIQKDKILFRINNLGDPYSYIFEESIINKIKEIKINNSRLTRTIKKFSNNKK